MEFGVIAIVLAVGYVLHAFFHRPKPALDVALGHLAEGNPVRAEYVVEQALRAQKAGSLAAAEAALDVAQVLRRTGDLGRALENIDAAAAVLGAQGAPLTRATALRADIEQARGEAPPEDDTPWHLAVAAGGPVAPEPMEPAGPEPKVADRCDSTGGCGSCGPDGVVDPDASRAFANLLAEGRAGAFVRGAEIRRDGDQLIPRVTLKRDLTDADERTVERAVQGAMGVLFG